MAGNPASSMMRALATSHTLASTSTRSPECIARNASAFFSCAGFAMSLKFGCPHCEPFFIFSRNLPILTTARLTVPRPISLLSSQAVTRKV